MIYLLSKQFIFIMEKMLSKPDKVSHFVFNKDSSPIHGNEEVWCLGREKDKGNPFLHRC